MQLIFVDLERKKGIILPHLKSYEQPKHFLMAFDVILRVSSVVLICFCLCAVFVSDFRNVNIIRNREFQYQRFLVSNIYPQPKKNVCLKKKPIRHRA